MVPWAVSCGTCQPCVRGLTSKCATTTKRTLAAYGFGPASGPWGATSPMRSECPSRPHARRRPARRPPSACGGGRQPRRRLAERRAPHSARAGGLGRDPRRRRQEHRPVRGRPRGRPRGGGVDYLDHDPPGGDRRVVRRARPRARTRPRPRYDIAVEASSRAAGVRAPPALAPGGVCTAVGYYLATGTRVPLMRMYATTRRCASACPTPARSCPTCSTFVAGSGFAAERSRR